MRFLSDDDVPGWAQRFQEHARQQAEALVPRPGWPIYGLASPALRPVIIGESSMSTYVGGVQHDQMLWEHITLCYGDTMAGPYVKVTTTAADGAAITSVSHPASPLERTETRLRFALETDEVRANWSEEYWAGGPAEVTRERLPAGDALVVRQDGMWAAQLLGDGHRPRQGQPGCAVMSKIFNFSSLRVDVEDGQHLAYAVRMLEWGNIHGGLGTGCGARRGPGTRSPGRGGSPGLPRRNSLPRLAWTARR